MSVVYTGKLIVGGGGIGSTAYHQVRPLYDNALLKSIYASDCKDDELKPLLNSVGVPNGSYALQDILFDGTVSLVIPPDTKILQTWSSHALFTMQACGEATSIINLFSAHISEQKELMKELPVEVVDPLLERKALKEYELAAYILVPSEFVLRSLKKYHLEEKAVLIPFGVDLNKFTPRERPKDDTFRAIFIGQNWLRKGLLNLIAVWEHMNLPNSELIVGGLPSETGEELKKQFYGDYKFKSNIKIGWIDDLVKAYQSADVFCLPALEDGCPLATYEAMACGVVPIVSTKTGTEQHIHPGTNGFIVQPSEVNQLEEILRYLYDNRDYAFELGKRARVAIEMFPWSRFEKAYIEFVSELI